MVEGPNAGWITVDVAGTLFHVKEETLRKAKYFRTQLDEGNPLRVDRCPELFKLVLSRGQQAEGQRVVEALERLKLPDEEAMGAREVLLAAGADVNLSDKVSSTCPIRRARSERRSRGEMANIAHSKPPLSCSLCRVPLLFPISGRQMSADGRLREAAFRNRSAPDCRRR